MKRVTCQICKRRRVPNAAWGVLCMECSPLPFPRPWAEKQDWVMRAHDGVNPLAFMLTVAAALFVRAWSDRPREPEPSQLPEPNGVWLNPNGGMVN